MSCVCGIGDLVCSNLEDEEDGEFVIGICSDIDDVADLTGSGGSIGDLTRLSVDDILDSEADDGGGEGDFACSCFVVLIDCTIDGDGSGGGEADSIRSCVDEKIGSNVAGGGGDSRRSCADE